MNELRTFTFTSGSHRSPKDGLCLMEAVAFVAGEEHTDHPLCACPVLSEFLRSWNDGLPSDAERKKWLGGFVFRLVGTKATPEIERQRSFMALDWLVRTHTPAFLDLTPSLAEHADRLRALKRIKDMESSVAAGEVVRAAWAAAGAAAWAAARDAARAAAGDAARDAAWDEAGAAARAAAWAAARDAARDAAGAAARDAARDAAGAAAWAAAGDAAWAAKAAARAAAWAAAEDAAWAWAALAPTVEKLKRSAQRLVDRMIRLTEPRERKVSHRRSTAALSLEVSQ